MTKLRNAGMMAAGAMIAAGMTAGMALAETGTTINVTLPEAVTIGSSTLPGGTYRISEVPFGSSAESAFVIRDAGGNTAAVVEATKNVASHDLNSWGGNDKTRIILKPDERGDYHLDKMFVEGDQTGYRFVKQR